MQTENKDLDYLRLAYKEASLSPDPSTQNGAILVDPTTGKVVAYGHNHFPYGLKETTERLSNRDIKLQYIEHAERDIIYEAARRGIQTAGLIMYVPWAACCDCARAIISAGIKKIVTHQTTFDNTTDRWKKTIEVAIGMLHEAGVENKIVTGHIGDVEIMFNGQKLKP